MSESASGTLVKALTAHAFVTTIMATFLVPVYTIPLPPRLVVAVPLTGSWHTNRGPVNLKQCFFSRIACTLKKDFLNTFADSDSFAVYRIIYLAAGYQDMDMSVMERSLRV